MRAFARGRPADQPSPLAGTVIGVDVRSLLRENRWTRGHRIDLDLFAVLLH
jgi:hypothetical protein